MRESVTYSTENGNFYLYDAQHMFPVLIHPELCKVYEKATKTDPYYFKKYGYLTEHGFGGRSKPVIFETTLNESQVKAKIIQTPKVVFEVTDHCNLNCRYCTFGDLYKFNEKKKERKRNINTHYAINLLKYIFDLKLKNKQRKLAIGFFGGEPLVNIHFIRQIVETSLQLNTGKELELVFFMTTNATLIHKHIHFLVENNFRLLISLDGNEEAHSYRTLAINNKNSFRQVIDNIDMIQREFPEYFADRVRFNAVLHNRNSVKNIYEFVYNRYRKYPKITQLNTNDINPDKKDIFERMFLDQRKNEEEYQEDVSDLIPGTREKLISYEELRLFLKNHSINLYILDLRYLMYQTVKFYPTDTCMPFDKKIFLTTRHNLFPCENVRREYSFGKVNQSVLIDFHQITRKFNFYYEHFKKICQYCYASESCGICLLKIANLDNLNTEGDIVCPGFRNQEAFKNELNRMLSFLENEPNIFFQITDNVIKKVQFYE